MKLLEKIDNYFYEKNSKKEFYYILVLIALALGFLIYYYLYPFAKQYNNEAVNRYQSLIDKIQREKIQLNVLKVRKIKYQKDLQTLNKKMNELRKEKVFFNELTNLMDFAEFNRAKWADFVKNIIMDAKSEGLKVKLVKNTVFEEKDKKDLKNLPESMVVKKMSVGLELKGNYINFIHFIYKYENMKDLIRVEKMEVKDKHTFYVEFTLYGYEK